MAPQELAPTPTFEQIDEEQNRVANLMRNTLVHVLHSKEVIAGMAATALAAFVVSPAEANPVHAPVRAATKTEHVIKKKPNVFGEMTIGKISFIASSTGIVNGEKSTDAATRSKFDGELTKPTNSSQADAKAKQTEMGKHSNAELTVYIPNDNQKGHRYQARKNIGSLQAVEGDTTNKFIVKLKPGVVVVGAFGGIAAPVVDPDGTAHPGEMATYGKPNADGAYVTPKTETGIFVYLEVPDEK